MCANPSYVCIVPVLCSNMEASGPFSAEVVSTLQSLYKRGMTGWGKKHSSSLEVAVRSTGLNLGQVKVSGEGSASDLSITTTILDTA